MPLSPLAGKAAPDSLLVNVDRLLGEYHARQPDMSRPAECVSFGTSGHRGTSLDGSFTEAHILAITQAICEHRRRQGIDGPLYLGKDTHALSAPAERTAIEVLAANGVDVFVQTGDGFTPTPVISHAILCHNRGRRDHLADGIIITPSHNPPADGGFKYNPPNGGPADVDITQVVQDRANELLRGGNREVKRVAFDPARPPSTVHAHDYVPGYVDDLKSVIDFDAIRSAGLKMGVDPLGGAARSYWAPICERYKLDITVVNAVVDPTFRFMTVDHDGQIRMDCSSPYAMAKLIELRDKFDLAFANDPDSDRHGIVTRSGGLMNPNHFLAAAIEYLFTHRPRWRADAKVGKTLVSSGVIDRVAGSIARGVCEVPVGFKWFVAGLLSGDFGFGGEESAGLSFLRLDGTAWTTDKDGPIANLIAAEMTARIGQDPWQAYQKIESRFGRAYYKRVDQPASGEIRAALKNLSPEAVKRSTLAGEAITARLTRAPGNQAAIGGLKVVTENGWFAARPSGTEPIYKIYAESLKSAEHLEAILTEASDIVSQAI